MHPTSPVHLRWHGDIAVMVIDHPPVNALSAAVVAGFGRCLEEFAQDTSSRALVVACAGRTFVAGGDIAGFDDPGFSAAPLNRMLARMEAMERPVVAAVHGHALGGGLELALACHWRVAQPDAQLGLPEVKLGLLPGSLGTQRLPRLVGLRLAYELIASGRTLDGTAALQCGLVDALAGPDVVAAGTGFARELLARGAAPRRSSELRVDTAGLPVHFFRDARQRALGSGSSPAALAIVDALEASLLPFEQGAQVEALAFEALRASPESRALRYLFFAQRQARKAPASRTALQPMVDAYHAAARALVRGGASAARVNAAMEAFGFPRGPLRGEAAEDASPGGVAGGMADGEIRERLLYTLVNEGARLLERGEVAAAAAIDVAWTGELGFPAHRGGPMFFGDSVGPGQVVTRLSEFAEAHAAGAHRYAPVPLLRRLAASGGRLRDAVSSTASAPGQPPVPHPPCPPGAPSGTWSGC